MTDKERERFISKVEELGGDVEKACKTTGVEEAKVMINFLKSRKQA